MTIYQQHVLGDVIYDDGIIEAEEMDGMPNGSYKGKYVCGGYDDDGPVVMTKWAYEMKTMGPEVAKGLWIWRDNIKEVHQKLIIL
tara:strand:+ start:267 stop:521 length:255 start_codon:yes stop_codon:yes gene_type:complete